MEAAGLEYFRRTLAYVGAQLNKLNVTQRLLIVMTATVLLMVFFLVSVYAGSAKMVEVIPGGSADDQTKAAEVLDRAGVQYTMRSNKVVVAEDKRYTALALLTKEQALPSDKKLMFTGLLTQQSWMMSNKQLDQMYTTALTNELASVMRHFDGIQDASVFISNPEAKGIGTAATKAVAQVTVFPRKGTSLDQTTVNAFADLVAGAVSGLDLRNVAIIDGTNRRPYRAMSPDDFFAGSYIEQVAKVESRCQEKIVEHLRFIQDVIVSVNAIVDGAQRQTTERRFLNKGDGTVTVPAEESTTSSTSTAGGKGGAEPGIASNTGMDISRSPSGAGSNTSDETSTNKYQNGLGEKSITQLDPRGKPTKINVTISVPRDYVAQIVRQKKSAGAPAAAAAAGTKPAAAPEPTDDEIKQAWDGADGVKSTIEGLVSPLVETDAVAGAQASIGTVKAFLIPVAMASANMGAPGHSIGAGLFGSGDGGMLSSAGSLMGSNVIKTGALGGLALLAVGLMFMMVRKAGKSAALPTAEELVGIPPALQPGSDVVGEADETDTAMVGIEVDPDRLRTTKMLDEVTQLVKSNPGAAASVFNQWLSSDN